MTGPRCRWPLLGQDIYSHASTTDRRTHLDPLARLVARGEVIQDRFDEFRQLRRCDEMLVSGVVEGVAVDTDARRVEGRDREVLNEVEQQFRKVLEEFLRRNVARRALPLGEVEHCQIHPVCQR